MNDLTNKAGLITGGTIRMELMGPIEIQVPPALNHAAIAALRAGVERAFADPAAVVVLAGTAECFCRGMDLSGGFGPGLKKDVGAFAACLEMIRTGPKPVIAAVAGPAVAGGVGLAAAADLVIASPAATFNLTELLVRPASRRHPAVPRGTPAHGEDQDVGVHRG